MTDDFLSPPITRPPEPPGAAIDVAILDRLRRDTSIEGGRLIIAEKDDVRALLSAFDRLTREPKADDDGKVWGDTVRDATDLIERWETLPQSDTETKRRALAFAIAGLIHRHRRKLAGEVEGKAGVIAAIEAENAELIRQRDQARGELSFWQTEAEARGKRVDILEHRHKIAAAALAGSVTVSAS